VLLDAAPEGIDALLSAREAQHLEFKEVRSDFKGTKGIGNSNLGAAPVRWNATGDRVGHDAMTAGSFPSVFLIRIRGLHVEWKPLPPIMGAAGTPRLRLRRCTLGAEGKAGVTL